jgi:hypothetical protein
MYLFYTNAFALLPFSFSYLFVYTHGEQKNVGKWSHYFYHDEVQTALLCWIIMLQRLNISVKNNQF